MLFSYQECLEKYGSDYRIKKELASESLFMKEKGIYSTKRNVPEIEIIMYKYPKTVCTGKSAFYYHGLTDVIPEHYYLASKRTDYRINDSRIIQTFQKENLYEAGITEIDYNNSRIRVYNRERMLIELLRFSSRIPMDYYKEIIQSYRQLTYEMDFLLIEEYVSLFHNGDTLMTVIQKEVL
ncbi:MAG: hypothetical protein IJM15_07530 [Erysipelotrichaceae bacterium]|nr:hypothetical protein [Erysipelotrichaceae bacterium]